MKLFALFMLTAFPFFAQAQVDFIATKQILIQGQSCEELEVHAQSIMDWTTLIFKTPLEMPECFCSSKSCQMDVASVSPYFVKELTNFEPGFTMETAHPGPNCFNAALFSSQTVSYINFTHPFEMTQILNSSLCSERPINEPLVPGDILVVRDQKNAYFEVHAGVYVNEDLSFSKYGESNMMYYSYGLHVQRAYGVRNEACLRVQGIPKPGEPCHNEPFTNYFRCLPHVNLVSKIFNQPGGIEERVRKIYGESSTLDNKISGVALEGKVITKDTLAKYQADLENLYNRSRELKTDPTVNADNQEFARLLHAHIYSLFEQTRRIAKSLGAKDMALKVLPAP